MPPPPRDADALDPLPDDKLRAQAQQYLAQHRLDALLGDLLADVLAQRPPDPLQFMVDRLTLGLEAAQQDAATGLPRHRRDKLEQLFRAIDKGAGGMTLRSLQAFANKHGGDTLAPAEAQAIFRDFKGGATLVRLPEFLAFFARASRTMTNADFERMVQEMLA